MGVKHWELKEQYQEIFCFGVFFMSHCDQCEFGESAPCSVVETGGNFATGFNDAGGQFAGGVVYTGGAAGVANIFTNF
jgi:hypothetical protein